MRSFSSGFRPTVFGSIVFGLTLAQIALPADDAARTFFQLHGVASDGVRASNDVYLAGRFNAISEAELKQRIEAWWRRFLGDPTTQRLWAGRVPRDLIARDGEVGAIDPNSLFRTAGAIRTALGRLRAEGRAAADVVRLERFAAGLVRDFVRRGIVCSYQLRSSMWYEPVWTLAHQDGYCVDYADWFYWTATMFGLRSDVVLAATPRASDYADHVLNVVRYADGRLELVEPQRELGFGDLAWVLVQSRTDGPWKLERVTPAELSKREGGSVRGFGPYAIEALRYHERARRTLANIDRCTFNPSFADAQKYPKAIEKATEALSQFAGYADVSGAGKVTYEAAILLRLAELQRAVGQQQLADKLAAALRATLQSYTRPSNALPIRIDALFMLAEYQERAAQWVGSRDVARAFQLLDEAEQSLRSAVDLGADSRWKYLDHNFDLRMARICNLRAQVLNGGAHSGLVPSRVLANDARALAHAEKAVAAHRLLRERLDRELTTGDMRRGFGLLNKRTFRKQADRYLRESYLTLGDVHQSRALTLLNAARQEENAQRRQSQLQEAEKRLLVAVNLFSKRSQTDDVTSQPDWTRVHEARIHLARVTVGIGEFEKARQHLGLAERAADEIREHTPDPIQLRQWDERRKRLRGQLGLEAKAARSGRD